MSSQTILAEEQVGPVLERALGPGEGLLCLTPTWVPRSFLHPGKRIKLQSVNQGRRIRPLVLPTFNEGI